MLCCCFVPYLNVKVSKIMDMKFGIEDALDLVRIIQRRRPRWDQSSVMRQLSIAAKGGASLGATVTAAEKAMNNPKHTSPPSIMFPENWEQSGSKTAGNVAGPRVCMECTGRFPADQVSKHPSGHGFICNNCEEAV